MYKELSSGVKISITRSISTSFEAYLASIGWEEDRFSMEDFMKFWQSYFTENAAWYEKIPQDLLINPEFHEEIAQKIDEVIEKILNEEPTEKQIETIEDLQKQLGTNYTYSCKAEAAYIEQLLKNQLNQ
ncbi:Group-specific protein OS=Ureibacillus acetophenoni OX=614649 GN=SAMN05877842_10189 PE=4 SV=1 [Ureibacillus acetophenoni]